MKNHLTSLETSKILDKLGVKQESEFVWVDKFPVFNDKEVLVSVRESKAEVASSRIRMGESLRKALAIEIRCRCPAES